MYKLCVYLVNLGDGGERNSDENTPCAPSISSLVTEMAQTVVRDIVLHGIKIENSIDSRNLFWILPDGSKRVKQDINNPQWNCTKQFWDRIGHAKKKVFIVKKKGDPSRERLKERSLQEIAKILEKYTSTGEYANKRLTEEDVMSLRQSHKHFDARCQKPQELVKNQLQNYTAAKQISRKQKANRKLGLEDENGEDRSENFSGSSHLVRLLFFHACSCNL